MTGESINSKTCFTFYTCTDRMFNILKIRSFKHCHNKLFFVNLMLLVYDMRLVSSFQNVSLAMHHICL